MINISPHIPRRALITGGATRIGKSIVLTLASCGFDVVVHCHRHKQLGHELVRVLQKEGHKASLLVGDLKDQAFVEALCERAQALLGGPLGILVNNASLFEYDDWQHVCLQTWHAHMMVNLQAPLFLMQSFARDLPCGKEALIINMLDQRVWSLTPYFMTYTLSKSALWTLTQTMALALAPKKIRVNAIGPGPTMASARQTQEQFARQCRSVPLRHGSNPAEIGRAVMALLTLPSMTGQMLALDGGQHLQWAPSPQEGPAFYE